MNKIILGSLAASAQSGEGFPAYNSHGKLISVKPFVSENAQLEVINIIDRGQSYEQMTQEIKTKVNELTEKRKANLDPFIVDILKQLNINESQ